MRYVRQEAKANGVDDDKAMQYAAVVGSIELATEAISSGLGKVGGRAVGVGGVTDDLLEGIAKRVSSDATVQNAVLYIGGVVGEGFEEWLSEWGNYFANRIMVGYDTRTGKEVWRDSTESFRQGMMMSAILTCSLLMQQGVPPEQAMKQGIDKAAAEAGVETAGTAPTAPAAEARAEASSELTPVAQVVLGQQTDVPANPASVQTAEVSPAAQAMADVLSGKTADAATAQLEAKYPAERITQAQEAYNRATEVQNRLDARMRQIAERLGIPYENGVQKSISSILSRMTRNENRGRGSDPYTLKDLARTHLELSSWEDIPKVLAYLDEMKIPYTTDAKNTQQGYKGFHITWNDNGIGIELQLSTPEAWRVKMETEKIYAKWREAEADPNFVATEEYWRDMGRSEGLWSQVDTPDFSIFANSSGVSGRESGSQGSPSDIGLVNAPHRPLENSSSGLPGETRITRPSGLINDLDSTITPPIKSTTSIAQNMGDGNTNSTPGTPMAVSIQLM